MFFTSKTNHSRTKLKWNNQDACLTWCKIKIHFFAIVQYYIIYHVNSIIIHSRDGCEWQSVHRHGLVTGQRVDEVRQQQVQSAIISIISLLSADVRLHHKLPLLQTVCLRPRYWETKLHCPSKQSLLYQDLVDFIIFKYLYQS